MKCAILDNCLMVILSYLLVSSKYGLSEIITLQKEENITCFVNEEDFTTAVFLDPPGVANKTQRFSSLHELLWKNDDWILRNASDFLLEPVMDRRWEGFPILERNYQHFQASTSISFSIYSSAETEIRIFVDDGIIMSKSSHYLSPEHKWNHYSISSVNNKVVITKNAEIVDEINDIVPNGITIKTSTIVLWKIHNYEFRSTDKVTEKPTNFTILSKSSYIMMHVLLCKTCWLKMTSTNIGYEELFESTDKSLEFHDPWISHIIKLNSNKKTIFNVYTGQENVTEKSYWGIDFSICDDNRGIYKLANVSPHICSLVNDKSLKTAEGRIRQTRGESTCPPGSIGVGCNITCESLLGKEYAFCERHRICEDAYCYCAEGYEGELCQERMWTEQRAKDVHKSNEFMSKIKLPESGTSGTAMANFTYFLFYFAILVTIVG